MDFTDPKFHLVHNHLKKVWDTNTLIPNPCPLPVSFEPEHLELLQDPNIFNDYVVAEKTDGIRNTLVIGKTYAVFVDRSLHITDISIICNEKMLEGTTVDGEIVTEETGITKFYIFDIMEESGSVGIQTANYMERMSLISSLFSCEDFYSSVDDVTAVNTNNTTVKISPTEYIQKHPEKIVSTSIILTPKQSYRLTNFGTLLRQIVPALQHDSDGFVFTPIHERVRRGRNGKQWKWKTKHTVDLRFIRDPLDPSDATVFYLKDGTHWNSTDDPLAPQYYEQVPSEWQIQLRSLQQTVAFAFSIPSDCIVECNIVIQQNRTIRVVPQFVRTDKTIPNTKSTVERAITSVEHGVTLNDLVRCIFRISPFAS